MSTVTDPHARYDAATALIVVDVQNDFADPSGSLFVAGGEEVVEAANNEMAAARGAGATIVATQDWHPPVTPHFQAHGGTWPVHCVRETWGAELHPRLRRDIDLIVRKGTGGEDGYSAFTLVDPETGESAPTGLAGYLRDRHIRRAVVLGLATDVCVQATALDAAEAGFDTTVLWEATRPVDPAALSGERGTLAALEEAGVGVVGSPA